MTKTEKQLMTNKWLLVAKHYVKIKQKNDPNFKTVRELFDACKVSRKDISKYYERYAKTGKDPETRITMNLIG